MRSRNRASENRDGGGVSREYQESLQRQHDVMFEDGKVSVTKDCAAPVVTITDTGDWRSDAKLAMRIAARVTAALEPEFGCEN